MRCADSNSLGYLPIKQRFTKQFASTSASLSVTPFARDTLLPKQIMLGIRNGTNERRVAANAAEVSNN